MFIFDEKARIIDCNKNMYEHLGYTKEEMLSLNIADFDALETQESIKKKISESIDSIWVTMLMLFLRKHLLS